MKTRRNLDSVHGDHHTCCSQYSSLQGSHRAKSVSFAPIAQMVRVLHVNDYTDEEYYNTWYSHMEYMIFKADIRRTIEATSEDDGSRQVSENDRGCLRGLETRTFEASQRKQQKRRTVVTAVLREQVSQLRDGIINPRRLAEVTRELTCDCQLTAHLVGMQDQRSVYLQQSVSLPLTNQKKNPKKACTQSICNRSILGSPNVDCLRKVSGSAA